MKKSVKNSNLLVFAVVVALFFIFFTKTVEAFQGDFKTYSQKVSDLDFTSRYSVATGNFSRLGGSYLSFPANYGYKSYDFDISYRTTVADKALAIFGDVQINSAESNSLTTTRTNSGISQILVGTDYIMYHGSYDFIPEFTFIYPLIQNDFNGDAVAINEGVMELSGKLIVQTKFGNSFLMGAFAGFDYRAGGRASLIPYGLQTELKFQSWSLAGNLQGYSSANYDESSTNTSVRDAWFLRANGSSRRYGAINPELLETNIWTKIATTKNLNLLLGYGMTLNGSNIANTWNLMAGFNYRIPSEENAPKKTKEEAFKEEVDDGVDQSLFTPAEEKPAPTQKIKPKPKTEETVISPEILQKELDKTEMQIELKTKNRNRK